MKKKLVLVIDAEVHILHIIEYTLSQAGFEVVTAWDYGEGEQVMETKHPDIVIADQMPGRLGFYDFVRSLRESEEHRNLPVMALSTGSRLVDQDMAFEAGANMFMVKPFSPRRLVENINELLARPISSQE